MMEGPKTIAGEKGTVSERSFVMVSFCSSLMCERSKCDRSSLMVSLDNSLERSVCPTSLLCGADSADRPAIRGYVMSYISGECTDDLERGYKLVA